MRRNLSLISLSIQVGIGGLVGSWGSSMVASIGNLAANGSLCKVLKGAIFKLIILMGAVATLLWGCFGE
jgi:hypothetical protein